MSSPPDEESRFRPHAAARPASEPTADSAHRTAEPRPGEPEPTAGADRWQRLRTGLRPRWRRVDLAVAALLALLGFAVAVQVRSTRDDGLLANARQEDLVRILDELSDRNDRLSQEVASLAAARERLTAGAGSEEAALQEARRRAQVLGVLAGTVPAEGPGIELTLTDPTGEVGADDLLDTLEELRDAGAEAVQLAGDDGAGPVRVVASTWFRQREDGVEVDGTLLRPPYRFTVVGDPATLAAALGIPGGVIDNVTQQGGTAEVQRHEEVRVGALRALEPPRYARPAPAASPDGG